MERIASPPLRRASWVKRLFVVLGTVVLFLTPLLPAPSLASTHHAVVTATVSLSPLELTTWVPSGIRVGSIFPVMAIVGNLGDSSINSALVAIHLPKDVQLVGSKTEVRLGTIRAHRYAAATWLVRALKKGNYVILVSASGTYAGAAVTGQDSILVHVSS